MTPPKPQLNPLLKLVLDLGPLVLFFFANSRFGIFVATGTFMVAVLAALAVSYVLTRHLPIMPVVTAVVVLVFGGLDALPARRPVHQAQADHHLSCCSARCCSAA